MIIGRPKWSGEGGVVLVVEVHDREGSAVVEIDFSHHTLAKLLRKARASKGGKAVEGGGLVKVTPAKVIR